MGFDLRIYPQYEQEVDFTHDILTLERDSDLFSCIKEVEQIHGQPVSRAGIRFFNEQKIQKTRYEERIQGVPAGKLKDALSDYSFLHSHWRNRAFFAYLKCLPDDLELWLYWD